MNMEKRLMYFTMTATRDNEQIMQKKYLLPEKSQRVQVNGEECGAELCLEKTEAFLKKRKPL